mmetsp:Transcript_102183/g.288656  ORF Transcript_102183/g.288656 Transcript_102183/m.288656 type:complete len:301 (-) Transcript_102183:93-995(-)
MADHGFRDAATQVLLAGTSNATAGMCTNPIDVVKVRMQMRGEGAAAGPRVGVFHTGQEIIRTEGVSGLCRGLGASVLREMSYSGIRLGLYEPVKEVLGATDPAHTPLWLKVLAGGVTGASGSFLANPFDLCKVRMQAPMRAGVPEYTSVFHALGEIGREGGIRGLWRGAGPTVQRAALLTASQVPSYDHAKHTVLNAGLMKEGYLCHFVCSMFAGVVAAAVTSPSDLVKSRVMVQPTDPVTKRGTLYANSMDCLVKVARAEGPRGLYKGFNAQWMRIGPHTTITLMVFEQLRRLLGMSYL